MKTERQDEDRFSWVDIDNFRKDPGWDETETEGDTVPVQGQGGLGVKGEMLSSTLLPLRVRVTEVEGTPQSSVR